MPEKMKLAYLCLQATTEGQASHAHVHEIINGLRSEGWQVDLFEPSYVGGDAPGVVGRLLEFRRVQSRLAARLAEYDAVYVRAHPLATSTSRRARKAGKTVIQECNGPYDDIFLAWPAVRPLKAWITRAQREQYQSADAVIAVTPELAEWLEREAGRTDAVVVPNGANTEIFAPLAVRSAGLPQRYVVFFGALASWQGIETLLAATEEATWPSDVALVLAGDGALRREVEAAAAARPDRVRFLGSVPYRALPGIVAGALASLVPKNQQDRIGGLSPLKLYESLACGVPVIASDLPGLSDVVSDASAGALVPAADSRALAEAVAALAGDPDGAAVMGRRGREWAVANASWKARAAQTARVIEQAVRARR